MIKELKNTIYKRKSSRNYNDEKLSQDELDDLKNFIETSKSLIPSIKTDYDILDKSEISTPMRWKSTYYIAIYSEDKPNYKVNIGFIYQQVDLYLQSQGFGSCWIGMGKPKSPRKDLKYVILIGFGKSDKSIYRNKEDFKRKSINEITDLPSEDLDVARLAPSAINGQPWYFKKNNNSYDVFYKKHNFIKAKMMEKWIPVDMGIVLAHLYVANIETFEFIFDKHNSKLKGFNYLGTVSF